MPFASVNDITIHYQITGTGPPLVLIAGTGYPGATFRPPFVDELAKRSTVITFDHRGTGQSESSDGPYSTRLFATDCIELCRSIGFESAHFLGHSMGGRVAQWVALDHPDTVHSLVLAATGPGRYRSDTHFSRGIPVLTAKQMIELGYERYIADHIAETFFPPRFVEQHPDVVDDLVAAFWENRPSLEDYLKHIDARQHHQTADLLNGITAPCLIMVGDYDTGARGTGSHLEQSEYLAAHLPKARMVVLDGSSHGFFWQDPTETAVQVADWVEEHN
ncbi:MAG: alpha/beta hydrolase [Acidimicrobiia bacterium]|nr:alpha/beta hydrolase [Acidimicrobiia bacterium]MDH5371737.1 alpha/beta hydrolase [Acidimicrobiia bacterium]MDH5504084.1 alpha/beta hydrolase [Acidimicrobiia bacterium]